MAKIDLETVSQTSIVKLSSSEATAYVSGEKILDDNETLNTAIQTASEEISQGRSNVEYVIIAIAKDEVLEGEEKAEA